MHVFANVLQPLIDFFEAILVFFHDTFSLSWGAAIIALTLVVRATLMPLTLKQFKSMQRLAQFQPEIKKLQEKYKHDRERLNQETMKFYRENKVNPLASCLPLIAQLPVFLALFYMLQDDLRTEICPNVNPPGTANPQPCGPGPPAEFLFIPDITNKATGWVLVVLIVLYVGSQLFSTLLMSTTTDKRQRMIFIALPFFFVLFIWNFPAGLLIYWITTNVWTIVQQAVVRKRYGPLKPPEPPAEEKKVADRTAGGIAGALRREPAAAAARGSGGSGSSSTTDSEQRRERPPPPPRKKKKRSGRRR